VVAWVRQVAVDDGSAAAGVEVALHALRPPLEEDNPHLF